MSTAEKLSPTFAVCHNPGVMLPYVNTVNLPGYVGFECVLIQSINLLATAFGKYSRNALV